MKEFNLIFKYALSQTGVKTIKMRRGVFSIKDAPIEGILPFLIIYFNVYSRILSTRILISANISISKESLRIIVKGEPEILNNDLFAGLVLSLVDQTTMDIGVVDFIVIEDLISDFLLGESSTDSFSYDETVNEMMMAEYSKVLSNIGRPLSLEMGIEKTMKENNNEF